MILLIATSALFAPFFQTEAATTDCLKCHLQIRAATERKIKHPAVEMGCETCHINHVASGNKAAHVGKNLIDNVPALCLTCHDSGDAKLVAAHRGQPFATASCIGCHNPHGSDEPHLMRSQSHGPFAARQCEKCHQQAKDGKVQFTASCVNELCEGCHTDFKQRYDKSKVKHTLIETSDNACITCHTPHTSDQPKFLKSKVMDLCTGCHTDMFEGKKFAHEPARASCLTCHDAHSSNYHARLKADINTVCTACHGLRPPTQNSDGEPLVMPAEFPPRARKVLLDGRGKGHPYIGHPVTGENTLRPANGTLSCVSCHSPHSGNVRQMFARDLRGNALCMSCHANGDNK